MRILQQNRTALQVWQAGVTRLKRITIGISLFIIHQPEIPSFTEIITKPDVGSNLPAHITELYKAVDRSFFVKCILPSELNKMGSKTGICTGSPFRVIKMSQEVAPSNLQIF